MRKDNVCRRLLRLFHEPVTQIVTIAPQVCFAISLEGPLKISMDSEQ